MNGAAATAVEVELNEFLRSILFGEAHERRHAQTNDGLQQLPFFADVIDPRPLALWDREWTTGAFQKGI